ncbi:hypothetical protein CRD60_00910 [Bifidobacterium aemilianum]|uniref:Uncharacterized protein n=1 Tax=Bifidobacterium aemilianum TaxID=2493120 RepID=A0A366KAS5_9BIFI|nr:DUF5361 domain-containing protein [Bifidobacterium aemilianum]RBP98457.1 hypothetical protein CRD60_00910 [Bifidobacterium aemilianum]
MMAQAPDSLRADFQRFYTLDLDELGVSIRPRRAADLAANLPDQALTWGRIDPKASWGADRHLLANIADSVGFLAWTKTKESQRPNARWEGATPRPGDRPDDDIQSMEPERMLAMLALPRG